jgi:tetratricopeptide (TPR) repeat protein
MAHFSEHRDDLILRIYLDFMEGGSTSSPAPRQELVRFDQQHPWDLMAEIYAPRGQVYLYDSTGKVVDKIPLYENTEEQRYIIRLPLKGDLEQILDGRITYHAVITGFYDEISAFQPLRREASLRNSGGAADGRTPRIFDMLCIEDNSQQDILSAANPEIPFIPVIPGQIAQPSDSTYLEEIPGPTQQEIQAWENSLQKDDLDPMERGDLLFKLGRNVEALEYFTQLRKEDDNPLILAYLGTLTAQQAADKPVLEAVALVNKSFELFQEALAGNPPPRDRAYILIHRGHVSRHVPNSVFNKAVPGAQDFLGAAEILEPLGQDKSFIKELYLYAAHCYEIAEMEDLKELTLLKAKAIK